MKKTFIIFILLILILVATFSYLYGQYQRLQAEAIQYNRIFETYRNVEVLGTDVISIINRAIDYNERNEITKNDKNHYIENETNSIHITVKFLGEEDKTYEYRMEAIAKQGVEAFVRNFGAIKFKCTTIQYHKKTNFVKSLYFEQVS